MIDKSKSIKQLSVASFKLDPMPSVSVKVPLTVSHKGEVYFSGFARMDANSKYYHVEIDCDCDCIDDLVTVTYKGEIVFPVGTFA